MHAGAGTDDGDHNARHRFVRCLKSGAESLYSKIGLQNGDVVTRINGYEMSSPERGLEIYTKLKDAKQVNVDVKRRGKPMTLVYAITP